jgi:hypothetical protein
MQIQHSRWIGVENEDESRFAFSILPMRLLFSSSSIGTTSISAFFLLSPPSSSRVPDRDDHRPIVFFAILNFEPLLESGSVGFVEWIMDRFGMQNAVP